MAQTTQGRSPSDKAPQADVDFDKWARAVRQQMVEALKRRGNDQ